MLFAQYIRPNAQLRFMDVCVPLYYELLANELVCRGYEFQFEDVPLYRQVFLTAGKRNKRGKVEVTHARIATEQGVNFMITKLLDDVVATEI